VLSADPSSGFIAPGNNDTGILNPDLGHKTRNAKSKVKQQRAVRQKYVFVTASKRGQRYRDYFNLDSTVQLRVMGMEDTVVRITHPRLTGTHFSFVCLMVDLSTGRYKLWHLALSDIVMHAESRIKAHSLQPTGGFPIQGSNPYSHGARHYVRRHIVTSKLTPDIPSDIVQNMTTLGVDCRGMRRTRSLRPQAI